MDVVNLSLSLSVSPSLSIWPLLSSSESKAFQHSGGSPGFVSLKEQIGQVLSCLSSFLWRPVSMLSQWDPVAKTVL